MSNRGENLNNERIADYYTSLLHVSGADLTSFTSNTVYDGAGHVTGLSLSSAGDRVVINNYIMPEGCPTGSDCADSAMSSGTPLVKDWLNTFYPVGAIMLTTTPNNPMDKIFGTKWVLESRQRFTVGVGGYTDKNSDLFGFSAGGRNVFKLAKTKKTDFIGLIDPTVPRSWSLKGFPTNSILFFNNNNWNSYPDIKERQLELKEEMLNNGMSVIEEELSHEGFPNKFFENYM